MPSIIEEIQRAGIVPVVTIHDADKALPLADALEEGGLPLAEITLRTEAGEEAIRRIASARPSLPVGAGTVLTVEQADRARAAGARFAVSPGFNPRVVDHCLAIGLPVVPGCSTPSDMEQALERGLSVVKFFPAEQAGGLAFLKAVAAPYTALRFLPTGGIGPENLKDYLSFSRVVACGGSWMAARELIDGGRFEEIARRCREAAALVKEARGV